jgi:COMPASS component SWD2
MQAGLPPAAGAHPPAELTGDLIRGFKCRRTFPLSGVTSLSFHQDGGLLIAATQARTLNLYNCVTGALVKTLNVKKSGAGVVKFTHHANAVLASGTDDTWEDAVRYLSLHDNRDLRYFKGHTDRVTGIDISPVDDTFFTAALDRTVRFWDVRSDRCQGLIRTPCPSVVATDPVGVILAIATDNNCIKLFDRKYYEGGAFATFFFDGPTLAPHSLAFTPDGLSLVVSGVTHVGPAAVAAAGAGAAPAGRIVVLDSYEGRTLQSISVPVHQPPRSETMLEAMGVSLPADAADALAAAAASVSAEARASHPLRVSLSPGGQFCSAGSANGTVTTWDITTGTAVSSVLHGRQTPAACVAWNPRRAQLVSADADELAFWAPQA